MGLGLGYGLVRGLSGCRSTLEEGALPTPEPDAGFEEMGGVLLIEGISSISSSLTGVASPLSAEWCDGSGSSTRFLFFTFFVLKTFVLDLVPDDEEDGGW